MKLRPEEITTILKQRIEDFAVETDLAEVGTVLQVGDGIARVYGLESAVSMEMLEFDHGVTGIAFNLEEDNVGTALFGDWAHVKEGESVRRTGRVASVPVGEELIGRIVNPLGQPVDGGPPIETTETRPLEFKAPGVVDRQPVKEPVQTGIKAIDSMIPIGRGQRELIIGDRSIGKTALLVDTMLNQRGQDLICIYVAIGQKSSTVKQVYERLKDAGAMDYTIIVTAPANEAAPMKWMAPYAGVGDGRVLPLRRQARAVHVRRPLQARGRVPPDVAAAAAPAGTRGVPGRRLLPPLAPARACLQALGRARRRLADGAAGDRDAGRRRRGLHPDERHLDHRRADLPRVRPLLLRRPAGDQRRRLRVPRGRQRPGSRDAPGGRPAEARPLAVPRAGGIRAVRLGARPGHARGARPRRADGRDAQPAAVLAVGARGAGGGDLRRRSTGYLDTIPVEDVARFQDELREHLRSEGSIYAEIKDKKELSDELQEKLRGELEKIVARFAPSVTTTPHSQWQPSRTSGGGSSPSRTRARSRRRWSSSPPRGCGVPRRASRRCGRSPTGCWS